MESASDVSVKQPLTLVLMGRTGNGKSSTGNSILGRKAFNATISSKSVTKECKMGQCTRNGRVLNVIDTPGVFDTDVPREDVDREIVKCINLAKRGIHAILLVVALGRFTDEEAESIYLLQLLFGPKIFDYMMIVFTGGDNLEKSLKDHLQDCQMSLKRTINDCNSRMVVFNNHKSASANVKETQITELLEQVDLIVAENGGQPYSNDLFLKAQEMSSQLYHVKDKEKEQRKLLNETMEKNALEMQEMLEGAKAEYERNLESARRKHIEALSIIEKQSLEAKMKELEYKLNIQKLRADNLETELKHNQKTSGGSCIIM